MLTPEKKAEIGKLYKSKLPLRRIREITGNSQATIMKVVTELKIKKRGERYFSINRAKLKKLPEDYMSRAFSMKNLMKKYGIKSEQTLYRILNEFKVPKQRVRL